MPSPSPRYFMGCDLGQAQDYSTLVVLETTEATAPRTYAARHLQRWPLRTSYPSIARDVAQLAAHVWTLGGGHDVVLAVDGTGCGRPVVDVLREEPMPHVTLLPILITGGETERSEEGYWHVPKRNLVGVVQVVLQTERLKIASALPEAATLTHELTNFQMKIALTTGHDSYGAWREGSHDDLVLALACSLWAGERDRPVPVEPPLVLFGDSGAVTGMPTTGNYWR